MVHTVDIKLLPSEAFDDPVVWQRAAQVAGVPLQQVRHVRPLLRSIDSRSKQPIFILRAEVYVQEDFNPEPALFARLRDVSDAEPVIIVGSGPAGYFAALELIECGFRPLVFDRGKDVRARRRDLRAIQQFGEVNPDSNYCFGEGGAGTYSDGKLYTRSHKRGNIEKAMRLFVEHGANPDILVDAHPHIGSNKLPQIVSNIRATIEHYGGQVHFGAAVTDLLLHQGNIEGVVVNHTDEYRARATILATGHSARDIYYLLHAKGLRLEAKPFALGVRVEHPQPLIDRIQYHQSPRDPNLPAASYRLACQVDNRGVFSFCMCPGGLVVPAATAPGEIVVNGMSMSRRDSPFANSGVVVAVELEDLAPFQEHGVFAGLAFQSLVEKAMFGAGDGSQKAPALRVTDFVNRRLSASLPATSYIPGLFPAPLYDLLPKSIGERLRTGLVEFGKNMRGYYTEEAVAIGAESRTSSPLRIPRHPETYMHPDASGLFPAGEGAGFAGGIISAAMDGQNVAQAVNRFLITLQP